MVGRKDGLHGNAIMKQVRKLLKCSYIGTDMILICAAMQSSFHTRTDASSQYFTTENLIRPVHFEHHRQL